MSSIKLCSESRSVSRARHKCSACLHPNATTYKRITWKQTLPAALESQNLALNDSKGIIWPNMTVYTNPVSGIVRELVLKLKSVCDVATNVLMAGSERWHFNFQSYQRRGYPRSSAVINQPEQRGCCSDEDYLKLQPHKRSILSFFTAIIVPGCTK